MANRRNYCLATAALLFATSAFGGDAKQAPPVPPVVGEVARDFELKTPAGEMVRLSRLNKDGPIVLVVLRGYPGYQCPVCSSQVGDLLRHAGDLKATGARTVLVYPGPAKELVKRAEEFVRGKTLPDTFYFVIDPDYRFTSAYGLRWDASAETAYPATFVVDAAGRVRFAKVSKSHGGRAKADEVVNVLKEIR